MRQAAESVELVAPTQAAASQPLPQSTRHALSARARIVIVRFTSLGDVVKATGLPRQIRVRYPKAHVTMLTAEAHLPLIAENPYLDRAIGFQRREGLRGLRRLAQQLRTEGVDLMVDVHRSLRSRLLAHWVGAPGVPYSKRTLARWLLLRFGWNTYRRGLSFYPNIRRHPPRKEEDFAQALAAFGIEDDGLGPELNLAPLRDAPGWQARFAAEFAQLQQWRTAQHPVLGLAPVAAWALKQWPLAHFKELARCFTERHGGRVVVFGGPQDTAARTLAETLGPTAVSLVGRTSLLESAYFASLTDLVVANDTGMSHLTEAVGRDVVVLFGPTSEELGYFPARPTSQVIQRALPCRPCTRMGEGRCTHPWERACLQGLSVERVLEAVLARLEQLGTRSDASAAASPRPGLSSKTRSKANGEASDVTSDVTSDESTTRAEQC